MEAELGMEDFGHLEVSRDLYHTIKMEDSGLPVTRAERRRGECGEETRNTQFSCDAILPGAAPEEPSAGHTSLVLKMEEAWSHSTEKIWSLTLEIVCLLTGEVFPVMSGDHVTMAVSPPPSWTLERITMQKILEITHKITELLIGEVSVGCPDVAVSPSIKEQKCLEDNMELYTNIKLEDQPLPISPQRSLTPLYFQDSAQEGHLTSHHYLSGMKEEELVVEASGQSGEVLIKIEPSSRPVTPERPPLGECGDGAAIEETVVRSNERFMEEESAPDIAEGRQHAKRDLMNLNIFSECKTDEDNVAERISSHTKCGENNFQKLKSLSKVVNAKKQQCTVQYFASEKNHNREKPYSCPECLKCFFQKAHLDTHKSVHTGAKYSCKECGKCFTRKSGLIIHEKLHTGEKPFPCPECGKRFTLKSKLNHHVRIHTGEKLFYCSECGKCFAQKSDFNRHQRMHTGEKPYSCSECRKCFSQKSHLVTHKRTHTEEKYSCKECGKSYSRKSILEYHVKIVHEGGEYYSCSQCGKYFNQKADLDNHERIYKKHFYCSECGKCFAQKYDFIRHQRMHTGEKPYSCSECGKGYSRRTYLLRHQRIHNRVNV